MEHINVELKARTTRSAAIRAWLLEHGADSHGTDFQTDTYFRVPTGRLKLRQGTIENNLIHYERSDDAQARQSAVSLAPVADGPALKHCLSKALGVLVEVVKTREIYFVENVKIHLDTLDGLGEFVEIEAIAPEPGFPKEKLHQQCVYFSATFGIQPADMVAESYSDLLLRPH